MDIKKFIGYGSGVKKSMSAHLCLLLAVKSLHSCSEACGRVAGVKSQPFTIDVGLRQG